MAWSTATCKGILAAVLAASALAFAQAPQKPTVDEPRFDIRRFVFEGATLIPLEQLEASTAVFTGKDRRFADVQRALDGLAAVVRELEPAAIAWSDPTELVHPLAALASGAGRRGELA